MKLVLVSKTKSQAWYRTEDSQFDVLGEDLNTNTPAGRAAGAGAVWFWRRAQPTRGGMVLEKPFCTKAACLADLESHIRNTPAPLPGQVVKVIVKCLTCGQRNRVIVGTAARCGKCKAQIAGGTPTLTNFAQRLATADAAMSFGRMTHPEDYVVCATCGVTYHKRDAHSCDGR